jgi:F-type H+-transporting ATPase subunit b
MFLLVFAEQSIQLFPDGTLFIHIALILLMIWVLNRTFFRPINRILETRERQMGGAGTEAEEILADVAEKESKLNQAMLGARSEGYALIEKERSAAVETRARRIADAKTETSQRLAEEKRSLEEQAAAARATIQEDADVLADRIAATVLKG